MQITGTDIFIVSWVVVALVVDAVLLYRGGVESTISVRIIRWSMKYPLVSFGIGVVMGHFYWQLNLCMP
jgi:hypothetical protein